MNTYLTTALDGSPQHETADTAKTVDSNFAHVDCLVGLK